MIAIDGGDLAALVPHRGKMLLLSRIVSWDLDKHSIVTEYDIGRDCLFYRTETGGIPSWAGFEIMAQSIAALSGLRGRLAGRGPRYGFILSVSDLVLHGKVLRGTVRVEAEEETAVDEVYAFHCRLFSGGTPGSENADLPENADSQRTLELTARLTVMDAEDLSAIPGAA